MHHHLMSDNLDNAVNLQYHDDNFKCIVCLSQEARLCQLLTYWTQLGAKQLLKKWGLMRIVTSVLLGKECYRT